MKYSQKRRKTAGALSLPVRGAWVEIRLMHKRQGEEPWSLPVRGAWVEIEILNNSKQPFAVAPRAGSVG